jgi:hypothetical protein
MGLHFVRCLRIVDHGYWPVPVVPDVEDHIPVHRIGILEHAANVLKIAPANHLDKGRPGFDFRSPHLGSFPSPAADAYAKRYALTKHTSQYVKVQAVQAKRACEGVAVFEKN